MSKTIACFLTAVFITACAAQPEVHYAGGDAARPELLALEQAPDVRVVVNADEPIFFTDSTFWLYRHDTWWRSSSYRTGWVRADSPPERVTRISQPSQYIHYHRSNAPVAADAR